MKFLLKYIIVMIIYQNTNAQLCSDPLITSWIQSSGTATSGSAKGLAANVQTVAYDTNFVYIYASGIPSYRFIYI